MAEGTPLLRERTLTGYRGFESLRLRQRGVRRRTLAFAAYRKTIEIRELSKGGRRGRPLMSSDYRPNAVGTWWVRGRLCGQADRTIDRFEATSASDARPLRRRPRALCPGDRLQKGRGPIQSVVACESSRPSFGRRSNPNPSSRNRPRTSGRRRPRQRDAYAAA